MYGLDCVVGIPQSVPLRLGRLPVSRRVKRAAEQLGWTSYLGSPLILPMGPEVWLRPARQLRRLPYRAAVNAHLDLCDWSGARPGEPAYAVLSTRQRGIRDWLADHRARANEGERYACGLSVNLGRHRIPLHLIEAREGM